MRKWFQGIPHNPAAESINIFGLRKCRRVNTSGYHPPAGLYSIDVSIETDREIDYDRVTGKPTRLEIWTPSEMMRGKFVLAMIRLDFCSSQWRSCGPVIVMPRPVTAEIVEAA